MNNSLKVKGALIALPALVLCACQEYEPFDYATVHSSVVGREYTANFIDRYGDIDPNNDWGFGPLEPINSGVTRASVDVKLNEWLKTYANVPGYPFLDGDYYQVGNTNNNGGIPVIKAKGQQDPSVDFPYGDVTDYEIQYVSQWFRSHKEGTPEFNAAKVQLNISEFFIQNVSADADQESYDKNGNGTNKLKATDAQGHSEDCTFQLDQLACMTTGGSRASIANIDRGQDTDWVHINNFNSGQTNIDPENHTSDTKKREVKLITSAGTSDFACVASMSDGEQINKWIYDWVLVSLSWSETYNGKTYQRQGYYLAFDYSTHKSSSGLDYERDGYYSNWIVKITPAKFVPTPKVRRIMCEDLGNTYDFDFNDVVFDVVYENCNDGSGYPYEAIITLQAAGGTMPIYVGTDNEAFEAHKLLENTPSTTPINVKLNGKKSEISSYRIKTRTNDTDDIAIWVENTRDGQKYSIATAQGNLDKYNEGQMTNPDQDNYMPAPQKFAVPADVRWMQETKFIETAYPQFRNYVSGIAMLSELSLPWYHNANIESTANLWYGKGFDGESNGGQAYGGDQPETPTYKLEVACYNPELGTVTGSGNYKSGDQVTITATPKGNAKFIGWKWENTANDYLSNESTYTFTYTSDIVTNNKGRLIGLFQ